MNISRSALGENSNYNKQQKQPKLLYPSEHYQNGIINETITAPSIDILYYQILRKWQQFVLRTTLTGEILFKKFLIYLKIIK